MANTLKIRRGLAANRTSVTPAVGELLYTTDTKMLYIGDGATAGGNPVTSSGGGGLSWVIKTANYTATANQGIVANTSGGVFTITLPATPTAGTQVVVADGGAFSTNNLTIARNGSTIGGSASDLTVDISGVMITLIYDGATWKFYVDSPIEWTSQAANKVYASPNGASGMASFRALVSADLPTYLGTISSSQVTTGLGYTPANKAGDTFTGSLISTVDARAPIFYDQDNTAYYVNPASGSTLAGQLNQYGYLNIAYGGNAYAGMGIRNNYASASNFATDFIDFVNESGYQKSSIFGHLGTDGSGYLQFLATAGGVSRTVDSRTIIATAYYNQWDFTTSAGVKSNIYYDRDNTAYYLDPNNGGFNLAGGTSNRVTWQTTDSGLIVTNAEGTGQALRLGSAWTSTGIYCYQNLYLMSDGSNSVVFKIAGNDRGYMDASANFYAYASLRSPIYYDTNNTAYYCDPTGTSVLYNVEMINMRCSFSRQWDNYPGISVYNTTDQGPQSDFRIFGSPGANGGDFSVRLLVDGNIQSLGDLVGNNLYGQTYYDSNNTGYYLNPNSGSYLWALQMASLITGATCTSTDVNAANDTGSFSVRGDSSHVAAISFHRAGAYAMNVGLGLDAVFRMGGWSMSSNCFQMDGSGNLTMLGNVTAYSDRRIKKDIETIDDALELVSKMRGVRYTRIDTEKRGVGVIAQEMLEVVPEAVQQGIGDDETLSVAYGNLVGVMIEAIKELKAEVDTLKAAIH